MIEKISNSIEQTTGDVHVRQLCADDINDLRTVVEQWVRNPETNKVITEEVEDIIGNLERSVSSRASDRQYIVAESDGKVTGVMGLAMPSELIRQFATTDNPIEIINAFVASDARGSGVGTELLNAAEGLSRFIGATEIMVNSGPRYQDTAWDFYDKRLGDRITTLSDYYGPGLDAPVWSMKLV